MADGTMRVSVPLMEGGYTVAGLAISNVALSHEESCDCDVCKASHGDKDAWIRVAEGSRRYKSPTSKSDPGIGEA